jgi:hypothetical protein
MKTVYIIHGWSGSPNEPLHKWLKENLEQQGRKVIAPEMPDADEPHIHSWVSKLKEIIEPNEGAILVGHSVGCQAILRYLAELPEGQNVGGVVFLAPWTNLIMKTIEEEGEESVAIAKEWIDSPLDFAEIKKHIQGKVIAIFSDDDPDVPLSEKDIFAEKLGAEVIVEHEKEHFTEEGGVTELSSLLKAVNEV